MDFEGVRQPNGLIFEKKKTTNLPTVDNARREIC